jgi:chemotaxis protein CheD
MGEASRGFLFVGEICREAGEMSPEARRCSGTRHALPAGAFLASRAPAVIKCVLGSCLAVCLFDPEVKVGGIGHFMLPTRLDRDGDRRSHYYGMYVMDLLINEMMKLGAQRDRFQAQAFGAARTLTLCEQATISAMQNAAFITSYLKREKIPLLSSDLGGDQLRAVYFCTDTGRALVKRPSRGMLAEILGREQQHEEELLRMLEDQSDNVTLL